MGKKDIIIYGAGGLGREIVSLIKSLNEWSPIGFVDDGISAGTEIDGLKVLGGKDFLLDRKGDVHVVLAMGDPVMKSDIAKHLKNADITFPTLIHPTAILQNRETITLGPGTVLTAGCILTTDIRIGNHVLINLNTTIGHDVHIGNYCSIMPGVNVAGEVILGDCVLVGSGANILNRMVVSEKSRVGMGAVVTRPVAPGVTVVGVPARVVGKAV